MADRNTVKAELEKIMQEVFDDDEIEITEEMTADDVEEWDSLSHISLIVAIEKKFSIKLNPAEIGKLENVGQMVDVITARAA